MKGPIQKRSVWRRAYFMALTVAAYALIGVGALLLVAFSLVIASAPFIFAGWVLGFGR